MLSDLNMITNIPLAYCRQDFDYVDNHFYWDHPHFVETPWRLPSSFSNSSVIEKFASAPGTHFPSKIFGKPIMITEFNFAYPNSQRAEGGPITGAYASLQGWNALYRFGYAHDAKFITQDAPNTYFDTSVDPINMLSDKIALLMFLREDVSESTESIPFLLSEKYYENPSAKNYFPSIAWKTGLIKKVGTIIVSNKTTIPKNAIAAMGLEKTLSNNLTIPFFDVSEEKEKNIFEEMLNKALLKGINQEQTEFLSSTGEINLNQKEKTFKVITKKSETLIPGTKTEITGNIMEIYKNNGYVVLSIASIDGKELQNSEKMLFIHQTDVQNTKVKFKEDGKRRILEKWGELPHLLRKGEAEIKLNGINPELKVWAIDLSGKRIEEIPIKKMNNTITFNANTFLPSGKTCMVYEISK